MRFTYEGISATGEPRRGSIEAESPEAAKSQLIRDGTLLTDDLRPVGGAQVSLRSLLAIIEQVISRGKIEYARLAFWRTADSYLRQSKSLKDVFAAVSQDCEVQHFTDIMHTISASMYSGRGLSFADALAEHAEFPSWEIEMVRVAERTKLSLTQVIPRIIEVIETKRKWKNKQLASTVNKYAAYPLLVIVLVYLSRTFFPTMVHMSDNLGDGSVPWYLSVTAGIAGLITSPIAVATVVALVVCVALVAPGLLREDSVRSLFERIRWIIPAFKNRDLIVDRATAVKLLAAFTHAGVGEVDRLLFTARSVASPRFRKAIERQAEVVKSKRKSFTESFLGEHLWGGELRGLIRSLGATELKKAFEVLAGDYESRAEAAWAMSNEVQQSAHELMMGVIVLVLSLVVTFAPIGVLTTAVTTQ